MKFVQLLGLFVVVVILLIVFGAGQFGPTVGQAIGTGSPIHSPIYGGGYSFEPSGIKTTSACVETDEGAIEYIFRVNKSGVFEPYVEYKAISYCKNSGNVWKGTCMGDHATFVLKHCENSCVTEGGIGMCQ